MVKSLRKTSKKPFDVHPTISPVDAFIPVFAEAGSDIITVHEEAGPHLHRTIQLIKSLGKGRRVDKSGHARIAVFEVLEDIDLVLVMSVNPGFGGQKFIPAQRKIEGLREAIDATAGNRSGSRWRHRSGHGEGSDEAGADVLVAGSATFKGGRHRYAANIRRLRGGK